MTVGTKAIRADVRGCIYGGAGARERAWASTAEAMADEIDRLRAAITQADTTALRAVELVTRSGGSSENAAEAAGLLNDLVIALREAIGIEVGP